MLTFSVQASGMGSGKMRCILKLARQGPAHSQRHHLEVQ